MAENDRLWGAVTDRAKKMTGRVPVSLLVHDIKQLNQEIRRGRYFYSDMLAEGIVPYDSGRFTLAKPKAMTAEERLAVAREDFRYWFESASGFWQGVGYYRDQGQLAHAAFLLHQAAERYYHSALLVFTGYKPKTHDLRALAAQTGGLHPALGEALPRTEPGDARLFDLLRRAYIEARYSKSYAITKGELGELRARVRGLAERVRSACTEELGRIRGVEAVGGVPELPAETAGGEMPAVPAGGDRETVERWGREVERMGKEAGIREGETRGKARMLMLLLEERFGVVPDDIAERVRGASVEELDRWARRVVAAGGLDEVFW